MKNTKSTSTLRKFAALPLIACIALASCEKTNNATETAAKDAAQEAALQWLPLVDASQYAQAREASADVMRNTIPQEQFKNMFAAVRTPLGAMESRKFRNATFATQMPGMPDGEYVTLQFDTVFANKKKSIETVAMAKGEDGVWKVAGYFIK